jgi:hypothetical protein
MATKAEKQAKYGPKREKLLAKLGLLEADVQRIAEKKKVIAEKVALCDKFLAEGDDTEKKA